MSRAKPCPKDVDGEPCGRPKMKGKQSCVWHWLLRQSSDVQATYATARRNDWAVRVGVTVEDCEAAKRKRVPEREWPDGERWCAGCQSFVPLFYVTGSRCKACSSMASHASRLESTYGIDKAEYDRIFALQGGRCAICRNKPASKRFAVDHDHRTGEVRGILCKRCNHDLLGGAHDSVTMLWRALAYLLFPTARFDQRPAPGTVVGALRAAIEAEAAQHQKARPEPQEPPF